jgi:murein DD-endopeptidase MepM/ murein hydrolase activator NlpD
MQDVVNQKNTIDQEIFMIYEQVNNLNEQINTYNLLIADKQAELDKAEADLEALKAANKARIRAMEEGGDISYWSVIFNAEDFSSMLDNVNMINDIAEADHRRLEEIRATAELVSEAKDALEEQKEGLEATKVALDASQKQLEAKREEADRLLAELVATGAEYEALLHEAEQQSAQIGANYDQVLDNLEEAERQQWLSTSVPTPIAPAPGSTGSVIVDGLTWVSPCNYTLLTSPFGWRTHPIYGDQRFHYGVDLAGPIGTPIVATRSGVITSTSYDSSSGYYVVIDHQDGFSSKYLHLTHYIVSVGEYVSQGQVIGYMGSTGVSTGPHLHFTVYYDGNTVNPAEYIDFY